jgi:hypothetical protein
LIAIVITGAVVVAGRWVAARFEGNVPDAADPIRSIELVAVGWFDWMLAGGAFLACLHAAGAPWDSVQQLRTYFLGQALGLVSLVPGGLGGADAFWIAHLPIPRDRRGLRRRVSADLLRRPLGARLAPAVVVGHAPGTAPRRDCAPCSGGAHRRSRPADHPQQRVPRAARTVDRDRAGAAATAGRGRPTHRRVGRPAAADARAWTGTRIPRGLPVDDGAALNRGGIGGAEGLDWKRPSSSAGSRRVGGFYAGLFDRDSRGDWLQGGDVALALAGVSVFIVFGTLAHRLEPGAILRWTELGYRLEAMRFVRTAAALALWVGAAALYVGLRVPVRFERPSAPDIDAALDLHARLGGRAHL